MRIAIAIASVCPLHNACAASDRVCLLRFVRDATLNQLAGRRGELPLITSYEMRCGLVWAREGEGKAVVDSGVDGMKTLVVRYRADNDDSLIWNDPMFWIGAERVGLGDVLLGLWMCYGAAGGIAFERYCWGVCERMVVKDERRGQFYLCILYRSRLEHGTFDTVM